MIVEETKETPAPVSTKIQHLIPSLLTIAKGYVQALLFVDKRIIFITYQNMVF